MTERQNELTYEQVIEVLKAGLFCGVDETGYCRGCSFRDERGCSELWRKAAAEAIEAKVAERQLPEGIEWPRYEDGGPVMFGDGFVNSEGAASIVTRIALSEKHFTINKKQDRICKAYGNRIKRPEPEKLDTQEAIDDDITMPPWKYCEKHGIPTLGISWNEAVEGMMRHLLERQRKLMGGE